MKKITLKSINIKNEYLGAFSDFGLQCAVPISAAVENFYRFIDTPNTKIETKPYNSVHFVVLPHKGTSDCQKLKFI